jgi:hypothetical protein
MKQQRKYSNDVLKKSIKKINIRKWDLICLLRKEFNMNKKYSYKS